MNTDTYMLPWIILGVMLVIDSITKVMLYQNINKERAENKRLRDRLEEYKRDCKAAGLCEDDYKRGG